MTQILTSRRIPSDTESAGFTRQAVERGWADGLPCIPPTEALVSQYIEAVGRPPDEVIAVLPPSRSPCTVEKIAINAAMTAAAPAAMPLLCAAIEALSEPDFALGGVNATTAPVSPALIVNGPMRHARPVWEAQTAPHPRSDGRYDSSCETWPDSAQGRLRSPSSANQRELSRSSRQSGRKSRLGCRSRRGAASTATRSRFSR